MSEINNSSVFVLPVLGKHYTFYGNQLEQCYLYSKLKNSICFVFSGMFQDEELDAKLKQLPCFLDSQHKKGKYIYIYSIPDEYIDDINLFKQGKYSQMSEIYKQKILSCNISASVKDVSTTKLYKILHKHPSLKKYWEELIGDNLPTDTEVWSIPDLKREIY